MDGKSIRRSLECSKIISVLKWPSLVHALYAVCESTLGGKMIKLEKVRAIKF